MRRRTRVLAGLVAVLCFGGLLARLFTLQILDPSGYAQPCRGPAAAGYHVARRPRRNLFRRWRYPGRQQNLLDHPGLPRELADELVQPAAKALSEIFDIDYDATPQKPSKAHQQ